MWNAGEHGCGCDSTSRPARSKHAKPEKKSSKKLSKRAAGGKFSTFASLLSNSSLKGSKSLPLFSEKNRTPDGGKDDATKEYRRVASWSHYLESYGGERAVETAEQWMVVMSQLLIGSKFASGTYSRIYHGIYSQKPVAVKMMSQPEGNRTVSLLLEKQFTCEVALLSRLRHPNIIENARPSFPTTCPLALRKLIQQCWSTNPHRRPDFGHIVSVLERYDESFEEDPAFFLKYRPAERHTLFQCFRSCVSINSAASVKA